MTKGNSMFDSTKIKVEYYGLGHFNEIEAKFSYKNRFYHINCHHSTLEGYDLMWRNKLGNYISEPSWYEKACSDGDLDDGEFSEIMLKDAFDRDNPKEVDPTKIIWQSSLTEEMVFDLNNNEISLLVEALDQAVMEVCNNYEVKG